MIFSHPVTEDYNGRQRDLEFLQHVRYPAGTYQLSTTSSVAGTRQVTGIQKAIQRYVSILLTPSATLRFGRGGTNRLLLALHQGAISDRGGLADCFAYANADTLDRIRADDYNTLQYGETRDDERIRDVTLKDASVDYSTSTVSLSLEFTTEAGDSYTYVIPVGTTN